MEGMLPLLGEKDQGDESQGECRSKTAGSPEGRDSGGVGASQVVEHAQRRVHVCIAGGRPRRRLKETHLPWAVARPHVMQALSEKGHAKP